MLGLKIPFSGGPGVSSPRENSELYRYKLSIWKQIWVFLKTFTEVSWRTK